MQRNFYSQLLSMGLNGVLTSLSSQAYSSAQNKAQLPPQGYTTPRTRLALAVFLVRLFQQSGTTLNAALGPHLSSPEVAAQLLDFETEDVQLAKQRDLTAGIVHSM
jgi:hypothetical protein